MLELLHEILAGGLVWMDWGVDRKVRHQSTAGNGRDGMKVGMIERMEVMTEGCWVACGEEARRGLHVTDSEESKSRPHATPTYDCCLEKHNSTTKSLSNQLILEQR